MKTTYTITEITEYADTYTDADGEEATNYNLPGGWQIGCVLAGQMVPGSVWTAVKNTTETLETAIEIV
jgi:hypothetical protein